MSRFSLTQGRGKIKKKKSLGAGSVHHEKRGGYGGTIRDAVARKRKGPKWLGPFVERTMGDRRRGRHL